jgi:hypothetical protein
LDPVGDDVVGPGGCSADGRHYIFAALADGSDEVYAFNVSSEEWIDLYDSSSTGDMPDDIYDAGAMAYETGWDGALFVASDEDSQLFVYRFANPTGLCGAWNADDPIDLPKAIGRGVALAFRDVSPPPPSLLAGYLYLLVGNETRKLYRTSFEQPNWSPGFMQPGDGDVVGQDELVLDWQAMDKATEYEVQVAASSDFGLPLIDEIVKAAEFRPDAKRLEKAKTYYWRARAMRYKAWSDWGKACRFELADASGSISKRTFPPDGAIMASRFPVFDWPGAAKAAKYRLQVADSPSFSCPLIDAEATVSEYTATKAFKSGKYYWRTSWAGDGGQWSAWGPASTLEDDVSWTQMASLPDSADYVTDGGAMCFGRFQSKDTMYVIPGNNSTQWWNYKVNSNSWTKLTSYPTPLQQYGGASLAIRNTQTGIHALFGSDAEHEYLYIITNHTWYVNPTEALPEDCDRDYGSSTAFDKAGSTGPYLIISGDDWETSNFYVYRSGGLFGEGGQAAPGGVPPDSRPQCSFVTGMYEVRYNLAAGCHVQARVFDRTGRQVRDFGTNYQSKGEHTLSWDARDATGRRVSFGAYFLKLDTGPQSATLKLIVR